MKRSSGEVVVVGTAHAPETAERHGSVSAAAAAWQLGFARAIAVEWGMPVTCLSYLLVDEGAERPLPVRDVNVSIVPVCRGRGALGNVRFAFSMAREVWRYRSRAAAVFCYNPLVWTAPWAWFVSKWSGVDLVMIVAELQPARGSGSFRRRVLYRLERVLLRLSRRYIALFPASASVFPKAKALAVLNGTADENALKFAAPTYDGICRFVYAGSLTADCGVTDFLAAAGIMSGESRACEFHVFGRGGLPEGSAAAVCPAVVVHGFVAEAELNRFLGEGGVGVNPRRVSGAVNEFNTPYKLLYYLSRGVVTLSTVTEGVPEDLKEVCLRIEEGPGGIAAGMREVLKMSPGERDAIAARGRECVRRTRTAKAMADAARTVLAGAGAEH